MIDILSIICVFLLSLLLGITVIVSNVKRIIESIKNEENEEFEV